MTLLIMLDILLWGRNGFFVTLLEMVPLWPFSLDTRGKAASNTVEIKSKSLEANIKTTASAISSYSIIKLKYSDSVIILVVNMSCF